MFSKYHAAGQVLELARFRLLGEWRGDVNDDMLNNNRAVLAVHRSVAQEALRLKLGRACLEADERIQPW